MALDRQDIERRDFPIGRRGYEPEAVDAHLRRLADEVEELRRTANATPLAGAASEQVKAIVEVAEAAAADIRRTAKEEAADIRRRAKEAADKDRADGAEQARARVSEVQEATQVMVERLDALESELGDLVESLRAGAGRLTADLDALEADLGDLRTSVTGGAEAPSVEDAEDEAAAAAALPEAGGPAPRTEREEAPKGPTAGETERGGDDNSEGARLIALNMALSGTSREETERYLADNFQLEDRDKLLDEVYARVG